MPYAPPKPCCKVGCGKLTHGRYCDVHEVVYRAAEARRIDERRGSAASRGYDYRWQQRRRRFLKANPLCRARLSDGTECLRPATDVDHMITLRNGGADDESNYQALCHSCHSAKTAREDGGFGR